MQARLIKEYKGATHNIQVMPVDEDEGLPLPEIYGSVLVEEDLTIVRKTRRPDEQSGSKILDSVADMFYVRDKLVKRIILIGEAGHGKTVFCMKILDCWSKAKSSCGDDEWGKIGESEKTKYIGKHIVGRQGNGSTSGCDKPNTTQRVLSSDDDDNEKEEDDYDDDYDDGDNDDDDNGDEDEELQSRLSVFHLVFYIPFRHTKYGTASIVDLVVESLSECDQKTEHKIKQMLRDGKIKCLVILDGLDEWRAPDICRVRGFPDSDGLVNCTLLCTMRPWRMVNLRLGLDATYDKVVRILGLKSSSIETVISNVLVNFYGLKLSSALYEEKIKRFCGQAERPELQSLMRIPLMLTASCLVWNEEDNTSNEKVIYQEDQGDSDSGTSDWNKSDQVTSYFMTFFYLKLEEITITRAENKHGIVRSFLDEKRQQPDMSLNVPSIVWGFEPIIDFIEVLKPVGRLALLDLVSEEPHLVFPRNKLERDIGQSKVELALKAGILSQTKVPGLSYQQRISLSFYHKSIQEFIAALYMICGDTEALLSFRSHCNTVDKVMELSNMIMFVCGLEPVVGCQLSEHVRDVVNRDADIMQYRKRVKKIDLGSGRVKQLYNLQCKCFSEMKQNMSYTHDRDHTPTFHVTDVYLVSGSSVDVSVASELISMEDNSIVSVNLYDVRHPVHMSIQKLPGCKHLTSLYIMNIAKKETQAKQMIAEVLPQLVQLQCFEYGYSALHRGKYPSVDTAVVRAVQYLPKLRRMKLCHIILNDTATLPTELQKIELVLVQYAHFILPSLPGCPNLTSLHISTNPLFMEDSEVLVSVLPQLSHLLYINYDGGNSLCGWFSRNYAAHTALVSTLQHLTRLTHIKLEDIDLACGGTLLVTPHKAQLQKVKLSRVKMLPRRWEEFFSSLKHATKLTHIKLYNIVIGDAGTLLVTPHMTQLQRVKLDGVEMSVRRWTEFVSSLLTVQHAFNVILEDSDIDDDTLDSIHRSPHFAVTKEGSDSVACSFGLTSIEFNIVK